MSAAVLLLIGFIFGLFCATVALFVAVFRELK